MCNRDEGQIEQWDIRYPKRPLLQFPAAAARRLGKVLKFCSMTGYFGNMPTFAAQIGGKVYRWDSVDLRFVSISGRDTVGDFDLVPSLDIPVIAYPKKGIVVGKSFHDIPEVLKVVANPQNRVHQTCWVILLTTFRKFLPTKKLTKS